MRAALLLAILLPTSAAIADDGKIEEERRRLIEAVAALHRVDGDAVGYVATKGRFYAYYERLSEAKDATVFRSMLKERSPVARAMGLYGLARLEGKAAVPALRAAIRSRARFGFYPHGCVGSVITLGEFARTLLLSRDPLTHGAKAERLVDERSMLGIDLEILAANDTAISHGSAARNVGRALTGGQLKLDFKSLKALAPSLSHVEIVRGLGRSSDVGHAVPFLAQVLKDEERGATTRLAAASALTREGGQEAIAAIEGSRAWLDSRPEGKLTERFFEVIRRKTTFARRWRQIDEVKTWKEMEKIRDQVETAVRVDHPFAIWRLLRCIGLSIYTSDAAVRGAHTGSLTRMAAAMDFFTSTWNTWGTAPYLMEPLVVPAWGNDEPRPTIIGAAARERLAKLLRPHLDR